MPDTFTKFFGMTNVTQTREHIWQNTSGISDSIYVEAPLECFKPEKCYTIYNRKKYSPVICL